MTGNKRRRFWPPGTMPSDLSTQAARNYLKKKYLNPKHDLTSTLSVCRDFLEPSNSSMFSSYFGLRAQTMFFDLFYAVRRNESFVVAANIDRNGQLSTLSTFPVKMGAVVVSTIEALLNQKDLTERA